MTENEPLAGVAPMGGASDEDLGGQLLEGQRSAGITGGATSVDTAELLAHIRAMQARLDSLEAEKRGSAAPAVTAAAEQIADLIGKHATGMTIGVAQDHDEGKRLADDLKEAAATAVKTGDTSAFEQVGQRVHRWLVRNHPGPGDHTYYAQAVDRAAELGDIADAFRPAGGTAVESARRPVPVVAGSVVG